MYLLTYFSETANQKLLNAANEQEDASVEESKENAGCTKEHIFISADLWNVHKHRKDFHTTDRILHSWE